MPSSLWFCFHSIKVIWKKQITYYKIENIPKLTRKNMSPKGLEFSSVEHNWNEIVEKLLWNIKTIKKICEV